MRDISSKLVLHFVLLRSIGPQSIEPDHEYGQSPDELVAGLTTWITWLKAHTREARSDEQEFVTYIARCTLWSEIH
jgi:hypothetical protein